MVGYAYQCAQGHELVGNVESHYAVCYFACQKYYPLGKGGVVYSNGS